MSVPVRRPSDGPPLARVGVLAAASLLSYPAAFALHRMVDGVAGAALFMVTLGAGIVTLGITVSLVVGSGVLRRTRRARAARVARCGACRRIREVRHDVWICVRCDQSAAVTQPG